MKKPILIDNLNIAVLLPCYNEGSTIPKVINDFKLALPQANIYVYDNNSTDNTAELAKNAGAIVCHEPLQGKGYVISRMFSDIDVDIYLMCDGDATYDASKAPELIQHLINKNLDMLCGSRVHTSEKAYRSGHKLGNKLLTGLVAIIFGNQFNDMLTGYRVFSRRFVKSFPTSSSGFEIETQLTIHALEMQMRVEELPTQYFERPDDSISKLNTYSDGWRILRTILYLIKEEKPFAFFMTIFLILSTSSVLLSLPILMEYMNTGLVPRFPTAILSTGLMILSFLALACGLILDSVSNSRKEMKRLHYLSLPTLSK